MKTYLTLDKQLRSETDPAIMANLERKGWVLSPQPDHDPATQQCEWVDGLWVVASIPALAYTAEEWTAQQGYGGNRPTTLLYQKLRLDASGKSSPKLNAVQGWLDGMIASGLAPAASSWPAAPHSFEATLTETLTILNS
jgi:hypothetical protein